MTNKRLFLSLLGYLILLAGFNFYTFAQYTPTARWFQDPELIVEFIDDCAQFWYDTEDPIYGGFYTDINRAGDPINFNTKGTVPLSRDAYGFTRAFMVTGKTVYLDKARTALDFMYNHLWDDTYGGWYQRCNQDGTNPSMGAKNAFDQHYALLGITAFWEATDSDPDFQMLEMGYHFNDKHLWDPDPVDFGYYDQVTVSGFGGSEKSFNATVDAITTHIYNLYLLKGDQKYLDRLNELKSNIIGHLVESMDQQAIGFAEHYGTDWSINESETRTIMGHVLKTAWCLARIHRADPDESAVEAADKLVRDVLDKGYDHEFGGPYKDYDRVTGEMYMYGAYDTAKAWWQIEQAITAGLLLYEITGYDKYLEMADESLEFFSNHFVDPVYGEVYFDRARDGGRVAYPGGFWDENKGNLYKAAYHSIETGYYAYLYGKLVLRNEPVSLYYQYDPENQDRSLKMNPLALCFENLEILGVTKDGQPYDDFDADNRILNIPSGTGGSFKVTYTFSPTSVPEHTSDKLIRLMGNYPNPARTSTEIRFLLNEPSKVTIKIYDSHGGLVDVLPDNHMGSGLRSLNWNTGDLAPGVYFYTVTVPLATVTGKIVITK